MASLTVATMTSPIPAYRRPEPPSTRMHRISRAPVLSATRSRVSCWITSVSYVSQFSERLEAWRNGGPPSVRGRPEAGWLDGAPGRAARRTSLGLFEDLHDPPPLGGGQRTGLHHQHAVADAARVLLVVHLELAGATQHLAVDGVLDAVLDLDDDGLVHLVTDHETLAHLALGPRGSSCVLAHAVVTSVGAAESPSSRSRMIV